MLADNVRAPALVTDASAGDLDLRLALGKGASAGADALLFVALGARRLLGADELLMKLELLVCWFILSSIWREELRHTPPLNGKECGSARKEKG